MKISFTFLVLVSSVISQASEIKMFSIDKKGNIKPEAKVFSWQSAKCILNTEGKLTVTVEGKDYSEGKIELTLEEVKTNTELTVLITNEHNQEWEADRSESSCDLYLDNQKSDAGALKHVEISFKCIDLVATKNKFFSASYQVPQKNPIVCDF